MKADVVIIGGGPAGMSAAVAAKKAGAENVLIIERQQRLGGILEQCIHNGFGLHRFNEELTGPEYAQRYEDMVYEQGIGYMVSTMATDITKIPIRNTTKNITKIPTRNTTGKDYSERLKVTAVNREKGYFEIETGAVVLAMGCRERPRGALQIAGTRPAGVLTAGTAQKLVNIKGYMPGKKVVILGSGDIGLIMARRMTLEGAKVEAVCEIMEDSGGLTRNIVQCLQDFDIPLKLRHTVTKIHGKQRLTGVTIAEVDANMRQIEGSEEYIECDTLMLSVGLIPENELSKKGGVLIDSRTRGPVVDDRRMTSVEGIFACGNVVKVHELVDFVSEEGEIAGTAAAEFAIGKYQQHSAFSEAKRISVREQKKGAKNLSSEKKKIVICTICPVGCRITVENSGETTGNSCPRGKNYALQEISSPMRTLTTTMFSKDGIPVPVKTDRPVPREKLAACMDEINSRTLLLPIHCGDIIIERIGETDANVVCTRSFQ